MKQIIRGDKEPSHILAATRALEAHYSRYGEGNKYHPVIYSIAYRNLPPQNYRRPSGGAGEMRQVANASNHRGNHGFTSGNHLNLIKPAAVGDGIDNGMVLITFSVAGVVRFKRTPPAPRRIGSRYFRSRKMRCQSCHQQRIAAAAATHQQTVAAIIE